MTGPAFLDAKYELQGSPQIKDLLLGFGEAIRLVDAVSWTTVEDDGLRESRYRVEFAPETSAP